MTFKFKRGDVLRNIKYPDECRLRRIEEVLAHEYLVTDIKGLPSEVFKLGKQYVEQEYELKSLLESPLYKALL
jgi:hypothetical protein